MEREMEMELENTNDQSLPVVINMRLIEEKCCWICRGIQSDEHEDLVSPCLCRGVNQWVHQDCIRFLLDNQIGLNPDLEVGFCPLCKVQYIVVYNEDNLLVCVLNTFDMIGDYVSHYITAGIILSVAYWTAVSYGTLTMIQIMGTQTTFTLIYFNKIYMMVLILPSLPIFLILGKTINWEATLLLLVQKCVTWLPPLRILMPLPLHEPQRISTSLIQFHSNINPVYASCISVFFPTISIVVGNILFYNKSYSNVKKTLLGGLVYVCVKSALGIYQRYYNNIRNKSRRILDYPQSDD